MATNKSYSIVYYYVELTGHTNPFSFTWHDMVYDLMGLFMNRPPLFFHVSFNAVRIL